MSRSRRTIFRTVSVAFIGALAIVAGVALTLSGCKDSKKSGSINYHQHIAPIIANNCATCHMPGESAPFTLLTFDDVKKRDKQIVKVTQTRYMPPWLPEPGHGEFAGDRRMSDADIKMISDWVAAGSPEGKSTGSPPPPPPQTTHVWRLGSPDMVATLPQPYTLAAESKDAPDDYRNFVVPLPVDKPRWVRAVELHAGNKRVVHHAFIMFDVSGSARRRDAEDATLGYPGMDAGEDVGSPGGQFLSWQPGKTPSFGSDSRSWRLSKGTDMVLQFHMQPAGKPEQVQPSVGFYFTDKPPTEFPYVLVLRSTAIDIPAGEKNYVIESSYTLPVDADLAGILPHAHYLGRELQGTATLPDGSTRPLILIKNWDFNWQGDYRYAKPMFLPRGTKVAMRFTYDNSTDNVRNPSNPPKRVLYGLNSTDEMGELWLQLLPKTQQDLATLMQDYVVKYGMNDSIARCINILRHSPNDAAARADLGGFLAKSGKVDEGIKELRKAIEIDPRQVRAHFNLANVFMGQNKPKEAIEEFYTVLKLDPDHYRTHNNLGMFWMAQGRMDLASRHLHNAVRINPHDMISNINLAQMFVVQRNWGQAKLQLQTILQIDPDYATAKEYLKRVQAEIDKER
jgi:tetratricopeptide (TPR) repeat protein